MRDSYQSFAANRFFQALTLGAISAAFVGGAHAAPLTIVVPFSPGGGADTAARAVGNAMGQEMGEAVVVENRSGAAGLVGAGVVARSTPDGTTFLLTPDGMFANPSLANDEAQAVLTSLIPVANLAEAPFILAASSELGVSSIDELLDVAAGRQDPIMYGTPGVGSAHHLAAVRFAQLTDLNMENVPYRGTSAAATGLASHSVDLLFGNLPAVQPLADGGKADILAVTTAGRFPLAPDVPAVAETLPGFEMVVRFGLTAAKGTPPEDIEKIAEAARQALQKPEVQKQLETAGLVAAYLSPQSYGEYLQDTTAERKTIMAEIGIVAE